eukprot:3938029-Rhodomonas_salina.6
MAITVNQPTPATIFPHAGDSHLKKVGLGHGGKRLSCLSLSLSCRRQLFLTLHPTRLAVQPEGATTRADHPQSRLVAASPASAPHSAWDDSPAAKSKAITRFDGTA